MVANSTLACRDYRDYFARRRQQIGVAAGEVPSAAAVTWTLSLGQAESLLPGASVRLMLVLVALLDGHGIPGAIFSTQAVAAYLGGAVTPFSSAVDPKPAWDALLAIERAGLISVNRSVSPPIIGMNSVLQAAIRLAAPANVQDPAARAAASALLEAWPVDEPQPWAAASLRVNAASLQNSAPDVLWADGCHPVLLRAGRSLDDARLVGPAVEYWRDLSARCDTKLMPGHPDALVVAAHLAAAYLAAGYAGEAVHWYQRVLAERGRELAPGHPAIIAARINLAKALVLAAEPGDAVAVVQRAVSECEQFRGPGHPDTLSARDELAAAHQAAGDVAAASRLLSRNLTDRERLQGPARRGDHGHPGPARRGLPGRRQDQGRHLALQTGTVRPREGARARPSGHARHHREPCRAPIRRPGGCRPRCSFPSSAARIPSESSVQITRTRLPAWLTWRTCFTP